MKKQHIFTGFLLIGIGTFFLLRQFSIPFLHHVYSWPTLVMLIGLIYLFYSYLSKDHKYILPGVILLGLGVHFYGRMYYSFWAEHWAVYPLIIGAAFLIRFTKTKSGLLPGVILITTAMFGAFSPQHFIFFSWLEKTVNFFESYWSILIIATGFSILNKNKRRGRQNRMTS